MSRWEAAAAGAYFRRLCIITPWIRSWPVDVDFGQYFECLVTTQIEASGEIVRTETANGILDNVSEQSSNGEDNCKGHDELVLVNGDVKAYGDVSNEAPGIVGTDGRNTIPYLTHRGKPKLCQR